MNDDTAPRAFGFGAGEVLLDRCDGSVVKVLHPLRHRTVLLDDATDSPDAAFHEPERRWGKGFLISNSGSLRWDRPQALVWHDDGVDLEYRLGGIRLLVSRRISTSWTETYELHNDSAEQIRIGTLAVSTPYRDVYHSSADSLAAAVHAHIWTGGSDSWVWAVPMDGSAPGLGLAVTEGHLDSYSIESRSESTSSNIRGHIYLQVTDAARAPHAMGTQSWVDLEPGESWRLSWRLGWFDDLSAFQSSLKPLLVPTVVAAEVGRQIALACSADIELSSTCLDITRGDGQVSVTSGQSGLHHLWAVSGKRRSRVSLLFHRPLRDIVERRIRFIIDHQRSTERQGSWAAAFVPYDRRWGLRVLAGGWNDWSDVRERIAMPILLQEARRRDWCDRTELDTVLRAHAQFIHDHVIEADGTVCDDSRRSARVRLYNFPWYALFFANQYDLYENTDDLATAVMIMDRYYELGGDSFLAFGLGSILRRLSSCLSERGDAQSAERMITHLTSHARTFVGLGEHLPRHEVNYEQSMVAPLVDLLLQAHMVDPDAVPAAEVARRIDWLTAFAGNQPDALLRHVPIRHWDGYWFGAARLWGDVFPHHWSALSADVFLSLPRDLVSENHRLALRDQGEAILRSNLFAFADDGSATCAFVYPSCVNGNPAHQGDPLANDQDWALIYALSHGVDIGLTDQDPQ